MRRTATKVLAVFHVFLNGVCVNAFVPKSNQIDYSRVGGHSVVYATNQRIRSVQLLAVTAPKTVADLKANAERKIIQTQGKIAIEELDPLLEEIEAENRVEEPNRSPNYKGRWHVWYSDAPPPSNGKLGPFRGSAEQDIASQGDGYINILRLPPNTGDCEWLTVVLDGIWEDWDGNELIDGQGSDDVFSSSMSPSKDQDWGGTCWKVTFLRLTFSFFGNLVFSKDFPSGVSRVWRTTYLDDDTRIVRAGKTGRSDDESVFYMKRLQRPPY